MDTSLSDIQSPVPELEYTFDGTTSSIQSPVPESESTVDGTTSSITPSVRSESSMTCTICLQDYETNEPHIISMSCCHHSLHRNCVNNWMARNRTCPLCRRQCN
uniref:NEP1-interacting protein 2 n=1 Tax=Cacopsylla melanoneura TaxID=428564 RepID=A0A8D8RA80_9HEMI